MEVDIHIDSCGNGEVSRGSKLLLLSSEFLRDLKMLFGRLRGSAAERLDTRRSRNDGGENGLKEDGLRAHDERRGNCCYRQSTKLTIDTVY